METLKIILLCVAGKIICSGVARVKIGVRPPSGSALAVSLDCGPSFESTAVVICLGP